MSTFETPESTAAIAAKSRDLLKLLAAAIRALTPERTQEWERKIERVLEDGRALIDAAELGERIEAAFLNPRPIRRFVVVHLPPRPATADCYLAATDDGRDPEAA